jgi:hypothetical protein
VRQSARRVDESGQFVPIARGRQSNAVIKRPAAREGGMTKLTVASASAALALLWSAATVSAQRRGSATKSAASATINNQPTRFRGDDQK